ncbi:MAG: right-handed parallel beta-helix repeat-containing protein [Hyphomicrobiaceae bacterium]|nr:right-handed parallel beta-helix repeat-containing protein [Hyphomicrobiaceae bacterium]
MATIYVDISYAGGTSDGSLTDPYTSIQDAINSASNGDTIEVAAGTYVENLVIDKEVTINGANAGVDGADPRGPETTIVATSGDTILVEADNIVINGIEAINDGGDDVISNYTGSANAIDNLTITNSVIHFTHPDAWGITLYNSPDNSATFAHITNNKITGVLPPDNSATTRGILLYNNAYAEVTGNTISDVQIAIQTGNFSNANTALDIPEISGNTIEANLIGIYHNLHYGAATDWAIANNDITGTTYAHDTEGGSGIRIMSLGTGVSATVTDNDVSGFNSGYLIWNNDDGALVQGGTSSNNVYGISAIDHHPTFGPANAGASDDFAFDGVNFSGNDADLFVENTELSAQGTSNFSTIIQEGGTFDAGTNSAPTVIYATSLDDNIVAIAGNQNVDGFDGVDTYDFSVANPAGGAYADLQSGVSFSANTGIDTLSHIENLRGSDGNDEFHGDSGDNTFFASAGVDDVDGRGGSDTFDASDAASSLLVDLNGGHVFGANTATLTSIENANTGSADDVIVGSTADNSVDGGAGIDNVIETSNYADATIAYDGTHFTVTTATGGTDTLSNVEKVTFNDATVWLVSDAAELTTALANAAAGDTIKLADGTYEGNFTIATDGITLESVSGNAADVIIKGQFKALNGISDATPLNEWIGTATAYTTTPPGFVVSGDSVTIKNLTITEFRTGIDLQSNDGLTIDGVVFDENIHSIYKENGSAEVTNFTLENSAFTNSYHGLIVNADPSGAGSFDNVTLDNVSFTHMTEKGIYVEQLSNADFGDLTMTDVGQFGRGDAFGTIGQWGTGIDVNVKYGDFANVSIHDFQFTDVGLSDGGGSPHLGGGAISVKARDDGGYASNPATLDNVSITNGTIDGDSTGIRIGEPGKTTAGPSNVDIENIANHSTAADAWAYDNQTTTPLDVVLTSGDDVAAVKSSATGSVHFEGGNGADHLAGGNSSDSFDGGSGDDSIDGGAGIDNVIETSDYADATIAYDGIHFTVSTPTGGTDTLSNVEKVSFNDATVWLADDAAGLVQALANAGVGDIIQLAPGTYNLTSQLNITQGVTILGAGEAQTTLVAASSAYGIYITGDDVSISDLSVDAHAVTYYGIKVNPANAASPTDSVDNFSLDHVTVTGAGRSEIDLNGVDNSSLSNVTADGDGTAGVGIALTDSTHITLENVTTMDNGWGSIGLYSAGNYWEPGTNHVSFSGTYSHNEATGIYAEEENGSAVSDINFGNTGVTEIYAVTNDSFRGPDSPHFTFFFDNQADALAFAKDGLDDTVHSIDYGMDSVVTGPLSPTGVNAENGHTFHVGAGMSLQEAVDHAVDGDTIIIEDNVTITEQVTINGFTNLTIMGAGDGSLIHAPAVPVVNNSGVGGLNVAAVIAVINSTGVTIEDIKVDAGGVGDAIGGTEFSGIYFGNAGGTVDGVTVTGVRDDYGTDGHVKGSQQGRAIYVRDFIDDQAVILTNNTVDDFQKNGIDVRGDHVTATIIGNMITGDGLIPGDGAMAQNGIVFGFGASGLINNNTISEVGNNRSDMDGATGILVYQGGGGITVSNNHVSGATDGVGGFLDSVTNGIYVYATDGVDVSGNTVSGTEFGLGASGNVDGLTQTVANNFASIESYSVDIDASGNDSGGTIDGSSGDDHVIGSDHGDTINGFAGDDNIEGGALDDVINGGDGSDMIDGGGGSDTVVLDGSFANYTIAGNGGTYTVVSGADTDVLTHIEKIKINGVTVNADDARTNIGIAINSIIDPETGSTISVDENSATGTAVATVNVTNSQTALGDTTTFELRETGGGAFTGPFSIDSSGNITVTGALDFETTTSYALKVAVVDSHGNETVQAITINVADVNEAPNGGVGGLETQTASLQAGLTQAKLGLGALGDPDPNDTLTYTIDTLPTHGTVFLNGTALTGGEALTEAEFQALTYSAKDTASTEALVISVSDGTNVTPINVTINVTAPTNDRLNGNNQANRLDGGAGDDILKGRNGSDTLIGGSGDDNLKGGKGSDILIAGKGTDTLTGGQNDDTFTFGKFQNKNTITDFQNGLDKIDLSAFGFATKADAKAAFQEVGTTHDNVVKFVQNGTTIIVKGIDLHDVSNGDLII